MTTRPAPRRGARGARGLSPAAPRRTSRRTPGPPRRPARRPRRRSGAPWAPPCRRRPRRAAARPAAGGGQLQRPRRSMRDISTGDTFTPSIVPDSTNRYREPSCHASTRGRPPQQRSRRADDVPAAGWSASRSSTSIRCSGRYRAVAAGFAVIKHRGRTSGKEYETIVTAFRKGNVLAIALAHGKTNWVKNVLAAGEADIHVPAQGPAHDQPRVLPAGTVDPTLPRFMRRGGQEHGHLRRRHRLTSARCSAQRGG